jgi:hypothetical protein
MGPGHLIQGWQRGDPACYIGRPAGAKVCPANAICISSFFWDFVNFSNCFATFIDR